MKTFTAKTEEEALSLAAQELNVATSEITYKVVSTKKTLFSKKVEISCYTMEMVQTFIEEYIQRILTSMEFEVETVSYMQNNRIYCNINSDHNSILIGKGGVILRAINTIVRHAVMNTFGKHFEISVDINGYKEERYKKVSAMAKRFAKQVIRTKCEIKLDPMPSDERKVMHQILQETDNISTKSYGEGKNRHMVISYKG